MTKEAKQEFTLRISQANGTQMVVILYDMFLVYLDDAKTALAADENTVFHEAVRKARGCLNELLQSLNLKYEPAGALQQLYLFCIRRLATGEAKKEERSFKEIERVIKPLRDAYDKISSQNPAGPVMQNSQMVYAGLTYGRGQLNENLADQGALRGMKA